jgi:Ca2+-binding RTX toxin-like protein
MRRITLAMGALLASTLAVILGPEPSHANNLASAETVFNTDVASFGFGGIRNIGTGTITVAGVSGTVTKALLYWQGPTNSTDPAANATVTLNGNSVTGSNIGFSSDNCWGFSNSQAYRADVTALVPGNGSYSLANFSKPGVEINGVSLIVFFDDGNASNNRDVVLFHGNDSNISNPFDANGWNAVLSGINYSSGVASVEFHVGDGQSFPDAAVVVNGTTVAPSGAVFQGNTVPNGASAGATNGGLWDIRPFAVTSLLTPGPNTLTVTSGQVSDCLSLIVAAFNLPAGAAPGGSPCDNPPTPSAPPPGFNPIVGTAGPDKLLGTPGKDVVFGLGGNDEIHGLGGDDLILGGDGDDKLFGADGNDTLCGEAGRDYISGGDGNDTLAGGVDNDDLSGDAGDDTLRGGPGDDRLAGGAGTNTNDGGPGSDTCVNPPTTPTAC